MNNSGQLWRRWMWRSIVGSLAGLVGATILGVMAVTAAIFLEYFPSLDDPQALGRSVHMIHAQLAVPIFLIPVGFVLAKFQFDVFKKQLGEFSKTRWIIASIASLIIGSLFGFIELMVFYRENMFMTLEQISQQPIEELALHWQFVKAVVLSVVISSFLWHFSIGRHATGFRSWIGWNLAGMIAFVVIATTSRAVLGAWAGWISIPNYLVLFAFSGVAVVKLRSRLPGFDRNPLVEAFA